MGECAHRGWDPRRVHRGVTVGRNHHSCADILDWREHTAGADSAAGSTASLSTSVAPHSWMRNLDRRTTNHSSWVAHLQSAGAAHPLGVLPRGRYSWFHCLWLTKHGSFVCSLDLNLVLSIVFRACRIKSILVCNPETHRGTGELLVS